MREAFERLADSLRSEADALDNQIHKNIIYLEDEVYAYSMKATTYREVAIRIERVLQERR